MSKRSATRMKRVSSILRKKNETLTLDDRQVLEENAELVEEYHKRREKRAVWLSRKTEQEDTTDILQAKCEQLAQAIHDSEFLVVYTGAGISTAASIPDYRGPNGIWTLLQKGQDIGHHDLTAAEPTLTHMALSALYQQGIVRHVVSQNCDGLHLRSGLPKTAMSEVHGNMYIEVCRHCVPAREYVRTMDVTERTSTFKHTTGRRCYRCGEPLIDTIVHFGERGRLRWPLNWQGACQAANACDTILCLGSSLKVLKKYPWLWQMGRPPRKRPHLYIVNLQWTPKDKDATLKINGKCDEVMARVMKALGYQLPFYSRANDPIFNLATPLHTAEANTASRPCLALPTEEEEEEVADVVESSDVRWKEEAGQGSGEEGRKRKLECLDGKLKEEGCEVKEESKDNVKPLNGLHSSWGSVRVPLSQGQDGTTGVKYLKTEDGVTECKPELIQTKDEVKSESECVPDVKKEEEEEETKHADTIVDDCISTLPGEGSRLSSGEGQHGLTDDEEVKSEPPDSDEEFQTSDMEGEEPWEHMPDGEVNSSKSSGSCCSDSDTSEKGEECHTEDSDTPDSQLHKPNQVDYFKLAYASTNVQMAKQGQALLKQNDFYGTGLCIRSFVNCPKTGGKSNKTVSSNERPALKGTSKVRRHKARSRECSLALPLSKSEANVSSLPNHCQSSETLCSSDSEYSPCDCRGKSSSSSSSYSGVNDNIPSTCRKCHGPAVLSEQCVSPGALPVPGADSESVETSPDVKQLSESQVIVDAPQVSSVNCVSPQETMSVENAAVKTDNVICHRGIGLGPSRQGGDGSILLRTHIVDGIITTTCVEPMAKQEAEASHLSAANSHKVPVPCSSQSEVTTVTVPCLGLHQRALASPNKSAIYIDNSVSEAHVKAITQHLKCKRSGPKFSSELSTAESAELKSIWYQSFCGSNNDNNLSALTVMMEMNDCNFSRGLSQGFSYVRPKGTDMFNSSEKSSSVILKNICAEAVSDSAAQHRHSTKKKPKGSDDENVKCIWFWGFDSNAEGKEKGAGMGGMVTGDGGAQNGECHPVGRVTRSRTRASCDSQQQQQQTPVEEEAVKCHCSGSNPELCRLASLRPARGRCDEDIQRARDIIRRRRTCNYRRYEPIFEKKLVSLTYQRAKAKRRSKFETANNNEEEEEEYEEQESEAKEEEHSKASDGEEYRERDEKGERKFTPGWYGKGLRKGVKKKTRV